MKDSEVRTMFVELRAKNLSYNRIAENLNVSKQTLIAWSKELSHDIANRRAMELDEPEKYFALRERRIELFGKMLKSIKSELEKRDLTDLPTEKLFDLLLKYSEAVKSESRITTFSAAETGSMESMFSEIKHVSTWQA